MSANVDVRGAGTKLSSSQAAMAGLAVVVGVLGVLRDPWFSAVLPPSHRLEAVFGLLLWVMVIGQFNAELRRPSSATAVSIADCSRRLSRVIYLVLYLVVGSTQIMGLSRSSWREGVLSIDMIRMADPESRVTAIFTAPTDSQISLMYGLSALVLIRILSHRRRRIGNHAVVLPL